ncbi:S-adenosyl-L-methionine-dependent methyltransferase [Cytidiella melzeri]|nr:S-adenosyl-L-methionine-dependent methyltransferase [Cytidiella melzeri]
MILREVYGRTLNSQNDTYFLPADNEEHRRLDLQHHIYTLMLGGLYPAGNLVRWALRPRADRRPSILDIGTGSGRWVIDMAIEFSHCDVVGVDLAPPRLEGEIPSNCRFEIDDANLGFAHFYQSFDVVHARAISMGIRDYPAFLRELALTLRPGGILLLGEGEMQLYDERQRPVSFSETTSSSTERIFFAGYNAIKTRGGSIEAAGMSPSWLRSIDSLIDVGWAKAFVPIGPWIYSNEKDRVLAEMLRTNCLSYISGLSPLLLSDGYLPESVERMKREAAAELLELKVHLHSRWSFAWAVKKP